MGKLRHGAEARTRSRLLIGALKHHFPLPNEPQDCCSFPPPGAGVGNAGAGSRQEGWRGKGAQTGD